MIIKIFIQQPFSYTHTKQVFYYYFIIFNAQYIHIMCIFIRFLTRIKIIIILYLHYILIYQFI